MVRHVLRGPARDGRGGAHGTKETHASSIRSAECPEGDGNSSATRIAQCLRLVDKQLPAGELGRRCDRGRDARRCSGGECDPLKTALTVRPCVNADIRHVLAAVAELAAHGVEADRRAAIERLQSGGAVGMAKQAVPDLAGFPTHSLGYAIEQPPGLAERSLFPARRRREQQPAAALKPRAEHPRAKGFLKLGPERHHAPGRLRLEPAPVVGPERDRPPVETIVQLEPEDLPVPAAGEQEGRDERVRSAPSASPASVRTTGSVRADSRSRAASCTSSHELPCARSRACP